MSTMVFPDVGKANFLNMAMQRANWLYTASVGLKVQLFKSNITVGNATVFNDFADADFTGVGSPRQILNSTVWLAATVVANQGVVVNGSNMSWVQTNTTTTCIVYGYYVWWYSTSLTPNDNLICGENFDTPVNFNAIGTSVVLTPQFKLATL